VIVVNSHIQHLNKESMRKTSRKNQLNWSAVHETIRVCVCTLGKHNQEKKVTCDGTYYEQ